MTASTVASMIACSRWRISLDAPGGEHQQQREGHDQRGAEQREPFALVEPVVAQAFEGHEGERDRDEHGGGREPPQQRAAGPRAAGQQPDPGVGRQQPRAEGEHGQRGRQRHRRQRRGQPAPQGRDVEEVAEQREPGDQGHEQGAEVGAAGAAPQTQQRSADEYEADGGVDRDDLSGRERDHADGGDGRAELAPREEREGRDEDA